MGKVWMLPVWRSDKWHDEPFTVYHSHRDNLGRTWLWAQDGKGQFCIFRPENLQEAR